MKWLKDCFKYVWGAIKEHWKLILVVIASVAAIFVGGGIATAIKRCRVGSVGKTGVPWKPVPGDPTSIFLKTKKGWQTVKVPTSVKVKNIRAVGVADEGVAVVEVKNETIGRYPASRRSGGKRG